MRYDRVEDCPEKCGGNEFCHTCRGSGEARTPVTRAEILEDFGAVGMWAIHDGEKYLYHTFSPSPRGSVQHVIESNYERISWKEIKEKGYTCEQIDVIRREP